MCLKKRVPGQGYEYCSTPGKSQGALGPGYPTGYNSTAVVGRVGIISYMTAMMGEGGNEPGCRLWYLAPGTVSLQLVIRAIGVSHTACKDEFRRNLRSHSWSVFSFFIIDLLNFVFLRDCPSLASQSSNVHTTCGTFPAFLCFPASFEIRNAVGTYRYYYIRFVHTIIRYYAVGSHARPAQISPAIYSPAAQRSAVRRGAVPFAAVLCRCAVCFLLNIEQCRV